MAKFELTVKDIEGGELEVTFNGKGFEGDWRHGYKHSRGKPCNIIMANTRESGY